MAQPLVAETLSLHCKHQVSETAMMHPNKAQRLSGPRCNGLPNKWDCHLTVRPEHRRVRVRPSSLQTDRTGSRPAGSLFQEQAGLHRGLMEHLVLGVAR